MLKDLFCHRGTETQNYFSEGYFARRPACRQAGFAENAEKIQIKVFFILVLLQSPGLHFGFGNTSASHSAQ